MSSLAKLQLVGPILLLAAAMGAEATGLALGRMPDSASLWFLHLGVFAPLHQGDALIADAIVMAHGELMLIGLPLFLLACGGIYFRQPLLLALASNLGFLDVCILVHLSGSVPGRGASLGRIGDVVAVSPGALLFAGALLSFAVSHIVYIGAVRRERQTGASLGLLHAQ
jgi:hypothetical protein